MRIKTEAAKGAAEYRPKKTFFPPKLTEEQDKAWEAKYKEDLIARIKVFKPISAKKFFDGLFEEFVKFNANLEKPEWLWNDETINDANAWTLRDLAVLLENSKVK